MSTPIGGNRAIVDARSVVAATGGTASRNNAGRTARGVTSDSRAVVKGGAFVALAGDRFDGHDFISAAIDAGAVLVVVERGRAPSGVNADVVEVDDTLAAWGAIAHAHLETWRSSAPDKRVVAITGSAGKTTTKEMCAALLAAVGPCHASAGNLNNRVGLPAVALQLEPRHRFAVLEMGMNQPGEIAALAAIASPDVGVVVNVGLAHAGGVGGSIDDVAREKGALFFGVRSRGRIVANADDPAVMKVGTRAPVARVTFGKADGADVRMLSRRSLAHRGSQLIVERAGRRAEFAVPIPGEAACIDFLAALAAAEAAAGPIDDSRVATALASLPLPAGRMQVRRARGYDVIDDAYNANPASVRAALEALSEMPAKRRIAVLGEMKELGDAAPREHESLADDLIRAGVTLLISCGGLADVAGRAAASRGVDVVFAGDVASAARTAAERVLPGDVVLVKASRSIGAEQVVVALLAENEGSDEGATETKETSGTR